MTKTIKKEFLIKEQSIPSFCRLKPSRDEYIILHTIKYGPGTYKQKKLTEQEYTNMLNKGKWTEIRDDTLLIHEKDEEEIIDLFNQK